MRVRLLFIALLLPFACSSHRLAFNDGPPRARCQADSYFAVVDKPWRWSCILEGDLGPYEEETIGIRLTTAKMEEFPTQSIGTGLQRLYSYHTRFETEYYLTLIGRQPYDPAEFGFEVLDPSDPRHPLPPIDGLESQFDGNFWIRVEFFEVWYDGLTPIRGDKITEGTVRGKLDCHHCNA
jgi:hypothetical protein